MPMNFSAVRGRGTMQVVLQRLMWAALILTALLLFFSSFNTHISISSCSRPSQIFQHPVLKQSCQPNTDPTRKENQLKKLWASKTWNAKVDAMSALFKDALSDAVMSQHSKAMCISAGIGQEVMALRHLGVEGAIGIEVVESPPLVIRGDAHKHPFGDCTFDLEFSAHLAEALFPWRFVAEMERTLKPGGHALLLVPQSYPLGQIVDLFNSSKLVSKKNITLNGLPPMQLLFKKGLLG